MIASVEKILEKDRLTGRDVGRLWVFYEAYSVEQRGGVIHSEPFPITIEDINDLYYYNHHAWTYKQRRDYEGYKAFYDWARAEANMEEIFLQQLQWTIMSMGNSALQALIAEDVFNYKLQTPAILTEKQYEELKEAERNKQKLPLSELDLVRRKRSGVAVLKEAPSGSPEALCYEEPPVFEEMSDFSLHSFTDEEAVMEMEQNRRLTIDTLRRVQAYNDLMKLTGRALGISKATRAMSMNTAHVKNRLDNFSLVAKVIREKIDSEPSQGKELQQAKREILRTVFRPFPYKDIKAPKENMEEAEAMIKDYSAFREPFKDQELFRLLTSPDPDPGPEDIET